MGYFRPYFSCLAKATLKKAPGIQVDSPDSQLRCVAIAQVHGGMGSLRGIQTHKCWREINMGFMTYDMTMSLDWALIYGQKSL